MPLGYENYDLSPSTLETVDFSNICYRMVCRNAIGYDFVDYAIERKRFNVRQSVRYVNKNIGLVTGIGTVFALALMIPALSLAACCFVSLLSVIAGTIAVERMNDKSVK